MGTGKTFYNKDGTAKRVVHLGYNRYKRFPGVSGLWYSKCTYSKYVGILIVEGKRVDMITITRQSFFYGRRMSIEEAIKRVASFNKNQYIFEARFLYLVAKARLS